MTTLPENLDASLRNLLEGDPEAYEYFESLPISVKARLAGDGISSPQELAARVHEAERSAMLDYSGIYDDSDSWPNGPREP